jgi:hypothetical protein
VHFKKEKKINYWVNGSKFKQKNNYDNLEKNSFSKRKKTIN